MDSSTFTYRRLLNYATIYWKIFLVAILGMVLVALSQPAFAALMEPMLNGGFIDKDPEVIRWLPLAVIVVFLVRAFAGFLGSLLQASSFCPIHSRASSLTRSNSRQR